MAEFFLQNGGNSYAQPGTIIREVDNTYTDSISAQIVDPGTGDDFVIQFKLNQTIGSTSTSAKMNYHIMGQFNSVT